MQTPFQCEPVNHSTHHCIIDRKLWSYSYSIAQQTSNPCMWSSTSLQREVLESDCIHITKQLRIQRATNSTCEDQLHCKRKCNNRTLSVPQQVCGQWTDSSCKKLTTDDNTETTPKQPIFKSKNCVGVFQSRCRSLTVKIKMGELKLDSNLSMAVGQI